MKAFVCRLRSLPLLLLVAGSITAGARAQAPVTPGKPINIDQALRESVPADRAQSYYHFALAKWHESRGELQLALTEMERAKRYDDGSSTLRVELAGLLVNLKKTDEALAECQEAIRLDESNAEAYWLQAVIHLNSAGRNNRAQSIRRAVEQLEKMREVAPDDYRSYYALGGAYFELDQPEKAVEAFEKFQSLRQDNDEGYTRIAEYYQRQGENEKAVEYLAKAAAIEPNSLKTLMMLGQLYAELGKNQEAIPLYRKILQLSGNNVAVKRQLGQSLLEAGQFSEAAQILAEVVEGSPRDAQALTQLGRARLGARQVPEAIEAFRSALELNSGNFEAEFYLGAAYEQTGRPSEAAQVFERLLEKTTIASGDYTPEQKNNRALFKQRLAAAYQDMGEYDKSVALLEGLVKQDKNPDPHHVFLLVNAYRINRQLERAASLGKEHFEKRPKDASLGLVYARTLADMGKTGQGAGILQSLLESNPDNTDLYVNLSQVYIQGKRYAEAEKVLRRGMDLHAEKEGETERFKFQLAAVYERKKDFDRAETLFKEILAENPEHANALNYMGYMLADRGVRLHEAVEYVERALALEPHNGAYLDSLGWAFFKLNELDKAEEYLLRAVDAVKNDPVIHDHLGDLYHKTGNFEKAERHWSRSVSIGTEPEETAKVREKLEKLRETLRKQKRR